MEFILSLLASLADKFLSFSQLLRHKPRVTCDIHGVFAGKWSPDFFPEEYGGSEGIQINVPVSLLLANNGSVDTTIKDAYINVRYARNKPIRLTPIETVHVKIQGAEIGPRKIWGPHMVTFIGSLWDIYEPPQDLRAELIVEPVAQKPIRRPIKLFL